MFLLFTLTLWSLRLTREDRGVVGVAVPRGLAAGVLATLPASAGVPGTQALPSVVFSAVVTTILVLAVGFRAVRGRWPKDDDGREVPAASSAEPPAILGQGSTGAVPP